jgi:hypothetical protein
VSKKRQIDLTVIAVALAAIAISFLLPNNVVRAQTQVTGNSAFVLANFFEGSGSPTGTCNNAYNYGVIYWDHTNNVIWVCATNGWAEASSGGGGGGTAVENDVTYSATPTFSATAAMNTIVLTGPVTSSTIPSAASGAICTTFVIKNTASYSFAWPTNMKGGMNVGPGRNSQTFCYYHVDAVWVSTGTGTVNE